MLVRLLTYRNRRYRPLHASPLRNLHRIISAGELVYGSAGTAEQAFRSAKFLTACLGFSWASVFLLAALGEMGASLFFMLVVGPAQFAFLAVGARATLIIDDYAARYGVVA